jgi:hypothetical protein
VKHREKVDPTRKMIKNSLVFRITFLSSQSFFIYFLFHKPLSCREREKKALKKSIDNFNCELLRLRFRKIHEFKPSLVTLRRSFSHDMAQENICKKRTFSNTFSPVVLQKHKVKIFISQSYGMTVFLSRQDFFGPDRNYLFKWRNLVQSGFKNYCLVFLKILSFELFLALKA